jgi:hypothetical protein
MLQHHDVNNQSRDLVIFVGPHATNLKKIILMQEHRQQQASMEAEDSWDECHHILAHVKIVLKCF